MNPQRIPNLENTHQLFSGKTGLEIGGPSGLFRNDGFVPLYKVIYGLDGCNFSNTTLWEGTIEDGESYTWHKGKTGIQYISEATDLNEIPDGKYDFVISSNCLEHVANPMKALEEWVRVVNKGGLLLLALPNKAYNFDHYRPVTTFSHLLEDYKSNMGEDDMTHLDEILKLHDLSLDPPAGTPEQFKERSLKNPENRALHHHVFDVGLLTQMMEHFNIKVLQTCESREHIVLGRKTVHLQYI
ncbi:class I SAM-dependent methyltransferase [Maribacter halichondriae]|uniref:class I SAM-dependent methyltransferase n=1 Tax=Maribacter halichondriae TaxID=2980554 RepID=UPI00235830DE|nr:methyltransferase domain-containing protein [Maribacter sp. Hal144]